ncbi:MAG: translation initiation factor IF-2 [Candidatus Saccharibacteria bacterium]|nr:translation initiation factor IF-2 [Candidatus Saccharibacteria bacterium]MCY4010779.1 translation initiation factor IF-2 [Candidatus Saccharibacteria bacterium]MCY4088926.1 translation initiation factor IF-2 [Candidatus Saccharibacteria bacterium]
MTRTITIDQTITVSNLAQQLDLPATSLISQLIRNGLMLTLNERIDLDTVSLLIEELGLDVKVIAPSKVADAEQPLMRENVINQTRPPVVAVMGHVDHGKTSLLDKIQGSDQVSIEAGGITQHISAMQIKHQDRLITFLDTPGHEAFAAVREHGALLTDLVVLVVACDDGVKAQTLEAIRFAKKSDVKILVALTKIDKDNANLSLVKQQLAEQDLLAEDLGGQVVMIPLSSKTGQGIDEFLDMILLLADIQELQADSQGLATGVIIEASMKQGLGAVASVLIQEGVLRLGDFVVAGGSWGKIRSLKDSLSKTISQASASTPVVVSGFKSLPEFGQNFRVVASEKEAKQLANQHHQQTDFQSSGMSRGELLRMINRQTEIQEYKLLIKADVQGSLTAILDGLKVLDTEEVAHRVVNAGVGEISENDLNVAKIGQATIYCFHLSISQDIKRLATKLGVIIKSYDVIYELLEDVKLALESLLTPQIITTDLGQLQIKGIFKTAKTELICGGQVISGRLSLPALVRISREGEILAEDLEVKSLAKGSTDVSEVEQGVMCGVRLATAKKINLKENDKLEFYRQEVKKRTL